MSQTPTIFPSKFQKSPTKQKIGNVGEKLARGQEVKVQQKEMMAIEAKRRLQAKAPHIKK